MASRDRRSTAGDGFSDAGDSSGSDDDLLAPVRMSELPTPTVALGDIATTRLRDPSAAADAAPPAAPAALSGLTLAAPARLGLGGSPSAAAGRPAVGLDLASLRDNSQGGDDGNPPPAAGGKSELEARREKFAFFETHCSPIVDGVYVSGEAVARDRAVLDACGITHVINCNAFVIPNYHERPPTSAAADAPPALPLRYKTLWLQDAPGEDVASVLFDCFDFIRDCVDSGGRVLVHCSQGVSRSVSVVVGYLMWRDDEAYERAFARVKEKRGVANPNMGFACQLLQWRRRVERETDPTRHPPPARMYRIAPHSPHDPRYLVAKPVDEEEGSSRPVGVGPGADADANKDAKKNNAPQTLFDAWSRRLDDRGAFVVAAPSGECHVWVGPLCADREAFESRATTFARQLRAYDALGGTRRGAGETNDGDDVAATARVAAPGRRGDAWLRDALGLKAADSAESSSSSSSAFSVAAYDGEFEMYARGERRAAAAGSGAAVPWTGDDAGGAKMSDRGDGRAGEDDAERARGRRRRLRRRVLAVARPRLFEYPSLDPVEMYDADDLDEGGTFVLVVRGGDGAAAEAEARARRCTCGWAATRRAPGTRRRAGAWGRSARRGSGWGGGTGCTSSSRGRRARSSGTPSRRGRSRRRRRFLYRYAHFFFSCERSSLAHHC